MTDLSSKPVEQATAYVLPLAGTNSNAGAAQQVAVVPTQVRRPWQATIRTGFQALVALATLVPLVLTDVYESPDAYPAAITQVVFVAGLVSRIMAMPAVEQFLRDFLPFLAAAPPPTGEAGESGLLMLGALLIIVGFALLFATTADVLGFVSLAFGLIVLILGIVRHGGI